jgi:hypothetical protein
MTQDSLSEIMRFMWAGSASLKEINHDYKVRKKEIRREGCDIPKLQ